MDGVGARCSSNKVCFKQNITQSDTFKSHSKYIAGYPVFKVLEHVIILLSESNDLSEQTKTAMWTRLQRYSSPFSPT